MSHRVKVKWTVQHPLPIHDKRNRVQNHQTFPTQWKWIVANKICLMMAIRVCSIYLKIALFRLTITASCPMNLQYFPMDRQLCHIEIESCKFIFSHFLSFTFAKQYKIFTKIYENTSSFRIFYESYFNKLWIFCERK